MKFQISNFISKIRAVHNPQSGYSLLELIITMTVLAVLVMGTIPLVQNSIKRRKEQELREVLRLTNLNAIQLVRVKILQTED
jgi:prepilin-type N-terminal cleavage/methylation domain-containing protein